MSVTLEQVEQLRAHAAVSYEEARRALEACDGDLLDSPDPAGAGRAGFRRAAGGALFLPPSPCRPGAAALRAHPGAGGVREGREAVLGAGRDRGRPPRPGGAGSWRARLRELLAAAVDLLRHCTVNQFEVWRNGERMTALPVLILILLVLVAYWISLPLLVVGLFFGCKYRFSGPDLDKNRVGEVVNQVSAKVGDAVGQVRDEFKREFDKSRGKKGK